jgi:NADH-quinone oxidoreductase subunit L
VNLVALGLLGGAVAKSAQIPLHTWLPDAMEGPTPVSALIHAATMVTAGVYLIVRCHGIFEAAPHVRELAAGLGAVTLLVAGLIALVQTDIKRVIAYSTMSQIGYMFVGAGVGAYANGMFHLMTHAFFKALLFIGSLALVGIFPFAGFFSKDSIIAATMAAGWWGWILTAATLIGTFLTGLYAFRLFFVVFPGDPTPYVREHLLREESGEDDASRPHGHDAHAGEGPFSMMGPVFVLAILSVVGGWVQFAPFWHPITNWLEPVAPPLVEPTNGDEALASILALALGIAGIGVAWMIYSKRRWSVPRLAFAHRLLEHKLYWDEGYDYAFFRPAVATARFLRRGVEEPLVLGSVRGVGDGVRDAGLWTRRIQTGLVRTYALAIAASLAVLTIVFVAVR